MTNHFGKKKGALTTHLNLGIGARFLVRENAMQPKDAVERRTCEN